MFFYKIVSGFFVWTHIFANRLRGVQEEHVSGYNLVDPSPYCAVQLQKHSCPSFNRTWTEDYMSWTERTHQVYLNAFRMNPVESVMTWFQKNVTLACPGISVRPLRYDTFLQQAAKQFSFLLHTGCTFSHSSCEPYCQNIYQNRCDWVSRINTYQPYWSNIGENIGMTRGTEPLQALVQFLQSTPHCLGLLSPDFNAIGVGNTDMYWVQDFGNLGLLIENPLYDGTHVFSDENITFYANVYSLVENITRVTLHVDETRYVMRPMFPHKNPSQMTYVYTLQYNNTLSTPTCLSYIFYVDTHATYRLPESGAFLTTQLNGCERNYISSIQSK